MRKIVVMQRHEWLIEAGQMGDFAIAGAELASRTPPGVVFVREPPVALEGTGTFVLAADLTPEGEAELLEQADVEAVFADPQIAPFPVACPDAAVGTLADVSQALNVAPLVAAGHRGRGVRVAVVDTGIDGTQVNVSGGWSPWPGIAPGVAAPGHGTMCAVDVSIAAPEAQIHDYPLLRSVDGSWVALLSDAIRFFAEIMTIILRFPGPMVVTNSWGLFDRQGDAPVGNPQNYGANPNHPFNTITTALVQAGADVLFAAGNCGVECPDTRCGQNDVGPGNSIHGANSHPDVITVAAVTTTGDRLGYSSQGPGALDGGKPDVSGFSHFEAPDVEPALHAGTSAACPLVAGVVAAVRSKPSASRLSPAAVKDAIISTAVPVAGTPSGWNADIGHGAVNAGAAWAGV